MMLDNMIGITEGSYTGFCKSQLITCNFVKMCNGVCPFEDALKHADKIQAMDEQHIINHDRDWIIGCIEHDGFIHTDRFDKANQIILDALQFADRPTGKWIRTGNTLKCPFCGATGEDIKDDYCFNYCPNCGAYMGGGENDADE